MFQSIDQNAKNMIDNIIKRTSKGLDFLKKSDEIDYDKKLKESSIKFVTFDEVCSMHEHLGLISNDLLRPNLLESAINRPINIFLYNDETSIPMLGSELCFGVVQNHPFIDGNKRVAMICLYYFLEKNNMRFDFDQMFIANLILQLANHNITLEVFKDKVSK